MKEKLEQETRRYQCAIEWVREAGERLRKLEAVPFDVSEKKNHQDIVTEWDKKTEQFLREKIRQAFPGDRIVGEEFPQEQNAASLTWYIDPIDGTTNFASQRRDFAISVGCASAEGTCFGIVLDVMENQMYRAQRGQGAWRNETRLHTAVTEKTEDMLVTFPCVTDMYLGDYSGRAGIVRLSRDVRGVRGKGSMALELCQVASGQMQLCAALVSCPWDHNAARLILEEAGGYLCRMDGSRLPYEEKTSLLAGASKETVERVLREYIEKE